jgi:2-polyprenyl-3-methyl-5-hydroxy-6-metoxy-1,4-benzoquinol methylase
MSQKAGICPICGGSDVRPLFARVRGTAFDIARCGGCTVQMLSPQPTWEQIKAIYDAGYYKAWGMAQGETQQVAAMKKSTFQRHLRRIARSITGGKILDVGTASGFFLEVAEKLGFEPWGVELSDYSAGLAQQKFGVDRIWNGTLETAPFQRGSFAAVAMSDLLEHVTDPVATLTTSREFLEPRGIVFVMTPNTGSLTNRLMGARWTHYKAEHLFYFNRRSIAEAARRAGLQLVDFRPAVKTLTLRYVQTQLLAYPHRVLTPLARAAFSTAFFARDWQIPIVIGEFTAILKKV